MAEDKGGIIKRIFGRKREAPVADAPPAKVVEALVETLARALRSYHEDAIDIDQPDAARRLSRIERWAEDVFSLAVDATMGDEPAATVAARAPNWNEIQRTFAKHRRAERRFVASTVSGLRKAIVDVAEGLNRALDGDRGADERVGETMNDLRGLAAASTTDVTTLRRRVLKAVEVVEKAAMARATRHKEEVGRLNDTLRRMRIELRRANRRAETDPLTGLCNRATFDTHLVGAVELYTLRASPASLLIVDLDHFKRLNDSYGHRAGDAALRAVAKTLTQVGLKDSDLVARYGGEEFAVVLHDCHKENAMRVAEKIRRRIQALVVPHDGIEMRMTASIGIAQRTINETPEAWLERADQALYQAKHEGRDQVRAAA